MFRGVLVLAIATFLLIGLPAGVSAQDAKVQKQLDAAQAAFDKGRYEDAFEKFQKANQAAGGTNVGAILGALEASLQLGRYDGIITQISGASSDIPAEQAQIDALVGRAHLLTAYVVDPTASPAKRDALAAEHRKRAAGRFESAAAGEGDWSVRANYYLAEARAALGDEAGAKKALDAFMAGSNSGMVESASAASLKNCMDSGQWVPAGNPAKVLPSKVKGPSPRRAADGASILAAVLTSEGDLTCMRMLPPLSEKANEIVYETLGGWKYNPAENASGQPINVPYTVTLDFTTE